MGLSKLYEELNETYEQLEYLHYSTASQECINDRRASLHCRILFLEEEIDYQKRIIPLKVATVVFIVAAIGMYLYFMC